MKFLAMTAVAVCFSEGVLSAPSQACSGSAARKRDLSHTGGGATKRSTAGAKWNLDLKSFLGLDSPKGSGVKDGAKGSTEKESQKGAKEQVSPKEESSKDVKELESAKSGAEETKSGKTKRTTTEAEEANSPAWKMDLVGFMNQKSPKGSAARASQKAARGQNSPKDAKEQYGPRIVIGQDSPKSRTTKQVKGGNTTSASKAASQAASNPEGQQNKAKIESKEAEEADFTSQMARLFDDNSASGDKSGDKSGSVLNELSETAEENGTADDDKKAVNGAADDDKKAVNGAADDDKKAVNDEQVGAAANAAIDDKVAAAAGNGASADTKGAEVDEAAEDKGSSADKSEAGGAIDSAGAKGANKEN
ncbi:hypothetical protein XA68_11128 [Ophiocordyceps unilateralis]|uniref:Uncharacterized protein n=1 Tax=Ophiocordyceps unilateralis TaxID=268505 RepID=A0A2A9PHF4_OPHUN|nr:hypothetical protein XA68_11128 [Ophiocordyceps unilateralis]